jgi:hypothetical protein
MRKRRIVMKKSYVMLFLMIFLFPVGAISQNIYIMNAGTPVFVRAYDLIHLTDLLTNSPKGSDVPRNYLDLLVEKKMAYYLPEEKRVYIIDRFGSRQHDDVVLVRSAGKEDICWTSMTWLKKIKEPKQKK